MPTSRFSGCSTGPCLTDNASTGWRAEGSIDTTGSANDTSAETQINDVMSGTYNTTDLNTYFDTSFTDSGSGETDVVYRADARPFEGTGNVGRYFCDDPVGDRCDQGYVVLKQDTYEAQYMCALVCHETGHAVGLLHPDDATAAKSKTDTRFGCMMNAPVREYRFLGADPNTKNINHVY